MKTWLAMCASLFACGIALGQEGEPIPLPKEVTPPAVQQYSLPPQHQVPAYREVAVPSGPIYQYNYPADHGACSGHCCSGGGLFGLGLFNRDRCCCERTPLRERLPLRDRRVRCEPPCEGPIRGQRLVGRKACDSACGGCDEGSCCDSCAARCGILPRLRSWLFFRPARTPDCGGCCGGRPNAPLYQYFLSQPCVEGCGGCDGGCHSGHRHFNSPTGHGCLPGH